MSIGTIGVIRPSDVSKDDISIYYNYTSKRSVENNDFFTLNVNDVLVDNLSLPVSDGENYIDGNENLLEGIYSLKLPATIFNQLGIYTIYIKPKSYNSVIVDCGVLSSLSTINGIVLDGSLFVNKNLIANNALQGYRVEYIDSNGKKIRNVVRYVVTSNKVVPIGENTGNGSDKAIRYRFDDNGTLLFLQLTPSSSSDIKPNISPFIGVKGQSIILTNTYFTPEILEVELVENTIDTVANIMTGNQIKDIQNGVLTYYDNDADKTITQQFNLYEIKSENDLPLYEVREKRVEIDNNQNFNVVVDGI